MNDQENKNLEVADNDEVEKTIVNAEKTIVIEDEIATDINQSEYADDRTQTTQIIPGGMLRNRFNLLEIIGQGGMGTVYKALDKRDVEAGNTKFIAIKIINDDLKENKDLLKALHAEARKTQSLAHPNIVTVYDFDRDSDTVFMTMEYIEGVSLGKIIQSRKNHFTTETAIHLVTQLCNALIYAHSKNIIHSDLKPSNIFVDAQNHLKVFDFGISRVNNIFQAKGFDAEGLSGLTPSYASLEMFKGELPDPRDDIYALACITYELLTGHHPYKRMRADELEHDFFPPEKIPQLSKSQWKTLKKGLALDREARIPSVESFLAGMTAGSDKKAPSNKTTQIISLVFFLVTVSAYYFFTVHNRPDSIFVDSEPVVTQPKTAIIKRIKAAPIASVKSAPVEAVKPAEPVNNAISITLNKQAFKIGEDIVFEFTVNKPMYVLLAVINSNNQLSMLFPNPYQSDNYCLAGINYAIPPKNADFNISVEGPVGTDDVIAIMGDKPISEGFLKNIQSLSELKGLLAQNNLDYSLINYQVID